MNGIRVYIYTIYAGGAPSGGRNVEREKSKVTAGPFLNIKYTSHLKHRFFVHSYLII